MQLPRGTFREIKKNQKTGDVLTELEQGRFSGICSISCQDGVSTLVLKSGKCILAEYETFKGDAALERLLHALADEDIDAALSTMDEAQIQISLEFNKAERIIKTRRTSPASQKPVNQPVHLAQRTITKKPGQTQETNLSPPQETLSSLAAQPQKMTPRPLADSKNPINGPPASIRTATAPVQKEPEIPASDNVQTDSTLPASLKPVNQPVHPAHRTITKKTGQTQETNLSPPQETLSTLVAQPQKMTPRPLVDSKNPVNGPPASIRTATAPVQKEPEIPASDNVQTDLDSDFDTIDSMNLNKVTDKIREECKTMVKNLHLDHLMDRD